MAKLYIDAGHKGVADPGAVGNGLKEADLTLKIANYTKNYLLNNYKDISIKMSRTGNTNKSNGARADEANAWGADAYVSIHINAGGGTGFETYIYNGKVSSNTKKLQDCIHEEVIKVFPSFRDRGQKQANFQVLRETSMSAVLTENLFIDTKKDADFLKVESNLRKIGEAHAKGIAKYFGLKKKSHSKSTSQSNNNGKLYKVQVGAFADKKNAEKLANELKSKGYKPFIKVE